MEEADLVLTIGSAMKDEIVSRGIAEEKVGIIPNGVDSKRFVPRAKNVDLAEMIGTKDAPTFGYVSNMDHYRESQETLISATAVLKNRGTPMHCVLVGDGPRRELLEKLALSLGVEDLVHFTGNVPHSEVIDYYRLIDIFVVPRIPERAATYVTPLKPFEAMGCGISVVVSNLPALEEIVEAPSRGLTFQHGNADHLATVLIDLWNDPARMSELAENGREWVSNERSWESNGRRYSDFLNQLTARK